jgi:hypothetical protein
VPKPELPSRPADAWEGGFVLDRAQDVKAIEARGGLVVANGGDLFMLRPGDQTWKMRPPPEDIGPMHAVAVEPRGARRYAVASEKMFALFFKGKKGDEILRLKPQGSSAVVRALAWGGTKGPCALYVLQDDLAVLRMKPDLSDLEALDVEAIDALASDDNGVVAMVALSDEPRIYVTRDGVELMYRAIAPDIDPDTSVDVAVADTAVALVVDQRRVLVSRGLDDPFVEVPALASPEERGWKTGPIAFQGTTSDAPLLCARWENDVTRIIRVDPSGAALVVAELGSDEAHDPPQIDQLTWDASRSTLWGASPYVGIFRAVAPQAKGVKRVALS